MSSLELPSVSQFTSLKAFLSSDTIIPLGIQSKSDSDQPQVDARRELLADRLHPNLRMRFDVSPPLAERVETKPAAYLGGLITLLKKNQIYSKVFESHEVGKTLEANTSIVSVRELSDTFKELEKGQALVRAITGKYGQVADLSRKDIVDLKMLEFALGTIKSICRALHAEKEKLGQLDEAERIAITIGGISQFQNEIKKSLPQRGMAL